MSERGFNPKGFLQWGPNGMRLTNRQRLDLQRVLRSILDVAEQSKVEQPDLMRLTRRVTLQALDAYPVDRTCATCDFEEEGHCLRFGGGEIPDEFLEQGCNEHRADGPPF